MAGREKLKDNKVIVIGPRFAGKTCIFDVLGGKEFNPLYKPSTQVDFHKLKVNLEDGQEPVVLRVWEACGQDKLVHYLAAQFFRLAGYCIVVADILSVLQGASDESSLPTDLEQRGQKLMKMLNNPNHPRISDPSKAFAVAIQWKNKAKQQVPGIPCLLMINKIDLLPKRKVSSQNIATGIPESDLQQMTEVDLETLSQLPFTHADLCAMCEREGFVGYTFSSAKTGHGIQTTIQKAALHFQPLCGVGPTDLTTRNPNGVVSFPRVELAGNLNQHKAQQQTSKTTCQQC